MMLRHFPLAAWVTLCASLVAAGTWVRFDGSYLALDRLVLGLLFLVAGLMLTAALICWIPLLRGLPDDRTAGRIVAATVFCPAASMALLVALALESEAAADSRHRDHLVRLAGIIAADFERRGRMPVLFDDAIDRAHEPPRHRGDADGGPLAYRRLGPSASLLCAPDRRVHVLIRGSEISVVPWPAGEPDPCWSGPSSGSWAEAGH